MDATMPASEEPERTPQGQTCALVPSSSGDRIERLLVNAYVVPTDAPESDGTLHWNQTTLVLVELTSGAHQGIGYTYADLSTALFIKQHLTDIVVGRDPMQIADCWSAMLHSIRNLGRAGVASMAIAAVDNALWDLKARLLNLPLVTLLGAVRMAVPIYGSGGFTSYSVDRLQEQLSSWAAQGIPRVKMKVGRQPEQDVHRVKAARRAIGDRTELFVDANGAYDRKLAMKLAVGFADSGVVWLEEPVSSDDVDGLRFVRDRVPAPIRVAAGEYGYDLFYFRRLLDEQAVDVLQADASRCGGITGFLKVAALCESQSIGLSAHCAPSLHVHPACAAAPLRHIEYFHDHVRIEQLLFDGALFPIEGTLRPDLTRPGLGLEFKRQDASRYEV